MATVGIPLTKVLPGRGSWERQNEERAASTALIVWIGCSSGLASKRWLHPECGSPPTRIPGRLHQPLLNENSSLGCRVITLLTSDLHHTARSLGPTPPGALSINKSISLTPPLSASKIVRRIILFGREEKPRKIKFCFSCLCISLERHFLGIPQNTC